MVINLRYNKFKFFWNNNKPYTQIGLAIIIFILSILINNIHSCITTPQMIKLWDNTSTYLIGEPLVISSYTYALSNSGLQKFNNITTNHNKPIDLGLPQGIKSINKATKLVATNNYICCRDDNEIIYWDIKGLKKKYLNITGATYFDFITPIRNSNKDYIITCDAKSMVIVDLGTQTKIPLSGITNYNLNSTVIPVFYEFNNSYLIYCVNRNDAVHMYNIDKNYKMLSNKQISNTKYNNNKILQYIEYSNSIYIWIYGDSIFYCRTNFPFSLYSPIKTTSDGQWIGESIIYSGGIINANIHINNITKESTLYVIDKRFSYFKPIPLSQNEIQVAPPIVTNKYVITLSQSLKSTIIRLYDCNQAKKGMLQTMYQTNIKRIRCSGISYSVDWINKQLIFIDQLNGIIQSYALPP